MKKNIKEKIFFAFKDLLAPLDGKPALISAITVISTIVSIDKPNFATFLLGIVLLFTHFFRRHIQWVIFVSLAAGIIAHEGIPGILGSSNEQFTSEIVSKIDAIGSSGCGKVESRLPRPKGTAFIINVLGSAEEIARESARGEYKVRLTEKRNLPDLPLPGDSICFEASWYPVTPPSVPGAFDTQNWLKSQNLAAYGKFKHWKAYPGNWTFERSFFKFRQFMQARFAKFLDPAETGLLMGLLAGDRSGIPEMLRSDFQRSGLVHVLAISGFHVVLLAGMLMIFLKATGLPHKIVIIIAVTLLAIYVPVTGGSPAVRRAVMMFAIPQIGTLFGKPANTLNSLGVALLLIILPEPSVIWNPGFQLSFAATAGIIIGTPHNPTKLLPDSSAIPHSPFQDAFAVRMVRKHYRCACDFTWHAGGAFRTALAHRLYLRNILCCREILFTIGIAIDANTLGFCSRLDDRRTIFASGTARARILNSAFAGLLQELHRPQIRNFFHFNRRRFIRI